jgi:hypothetical protein
MQFGCGSQSIARLHRRKISGAVPRFPLLFSRNVRFTILADPKITHLIAHAGGRNGD